MTARGRLILSSRVLLLLAVLSLAGWFALGRQARSPDDRAALVLEAGPDLTAPTSDALVFEGPVELVGPDGSVLSSQTGARMEPASGSFALFGPSKLSAPGE